MSAFSFTAPSITEEQEEAERQALSEQEKEMLHDDLFGTMKTNPDATLTEETEDFRQQALFLFIEALDQIPVLKKTAYLQAVERVPHLVEQETSAIVYLRYWNFDAWAAASSLCETWQHRLKLFGEEHAFLPMTCRGAMSPYVAYLTKGIFRILADDDHGRAVLFFDRIRACSPAMTREAVWACFFYIHHCLMNMEKVQRKGMVVVVNLR